MDSLLQIIEKLAERSRIEIDHRDVIIFTKRADAIKARAADGMKSYTKLQIKQLLSNISEVLFDWSISCAVEKNQNKDFWVVKGA